MWLSQWWPRSNGGQYALLAFWEVSAWAGAYSAFATGEVCEHHKYTNQYQCSVQNVATAMFWYLGKFVDDWQATFVFIGSVAIVVLTWFIWKAQAALTSITAAQKKLTEITQRAYISVEPLGVRPRLQGDYVLGQVGFCNVGHLPAQNVQWFLNIEPRPCGEWKDFALGSPVGNVVTPPGTRMPRGTPPGPTIQSLNEACGAEEGLAIQHQRPLFLYVWGIVHYTDGLGTQRFTRFCHRYNWAVRGQDGASRYAIAKENARYHEYGNGTDESPPDSAG